MPRSTTAIDHDYSAAGFINWRRTTAIETLFGWQTEFLERKEAMDSSGIVFPFLTQFIITALLCAKFTHKCIFNNCIKVEVQLGTIL